MHYNRHRYYAPNEDCFTSQDPIRLAGGSNLAAYAPNPVEWVDPLGLSCERDWGTWFAKETGTQPPAHMERPHAHHIVFKGEFERSPPMQAALGRSRSVLAKYEIDPVNDPDALMWAENRGHTAANAQKVATRLEATDAEIGSSGLTGGAAQAKMRQSLKQIGIDVFGN